MGRQCWATFRTHFNFATRSMKAHVFHLSHILTNKQCWTRNGNTYCISSVTYSSNYSLIVIWSVRSWWCKTCIIRRPVSAVFKEVIEVITDILNSCSILVWYVRQFLTQSKIYTIQHIFNETFLKFTPLHWTVMQFYQSKKIKCNKVCASYIIYCKSSLRVGHT